MISHLYLAVLPYVVQFPCFFLLWGLIFYKKNNTVCLAARVANKVGQESDPQNFLLMHAMGPNVAGVLGSAVAAGVLLALLR